MATESADELSKLKSELDEISRREATFRLKTVKDFFAIEAKHRELQTKLEQKDVYIHQLHLERDELRKAVQAARADVEAFTWMAYSNERDASALQSLRQSFVWPLVSGFARRPPAITPAVPPKEFTYFLHTSPYRLYRSTHYTLRGWAVPKDGQPITGLRARVDAKTYTGQIGREEPEALAQLGPQANNPRPGFEVTFETPEGRHAFAMEAQIANGDWFTILSTPIWCKPDSA